MTVSLKPNSGGNPAGKLADVELHFDAQDGALSGLKLVGFAVWQRGAGGGRFVTFPARRYSLSGQARSYALLRPIADVPTEETGQDRIRELILSAYTAHEQQSGR